MSRRIPSLSVPTRQTSSSGRPKSPRIQVVLPEDLCDRLALLAEAESRTVSNMARVLIQQGVERLERQRFDQVGPDAAGAAGGGALRTDRFRAALERQQQAAPQRLRGAPRRLRLRRPIG
jgi:predicted transcriptional regulator